MRTTRTEPAVGAGSERRRVPGRGWITGRGFALLALAISTLAIDGCSSLGCKSCGGGRLNLFGRRRAEVVGAPIEPGPPMVIDQGAPGTVVTPGSSAAGAGDAEDNPMLAPLDSKSGSGSSGGGSGTTPSGSGSPSGALKTNKDHASNTRTLRSTPRRAASGTRALTQARRLPRNEPATRPARRNELAAADALLNDLPAPATEIGGDVSPPPSPDAGREALPSQPATNVKPATSASNPAGGAGSGIKSSSNISNAHPVASTNVDPAEPSAEPAAIGAAPGIKRFKAVDLKLAGGSFPNPDGLAWLAEKGYRTVLDLREPAQVRSDDLAAVNHQALRYVALPISESSLSVETFKRFEAELAQAGARPLYFFDADGSRAAALWYVKRIVVDLDDEAAARREIEEIGPLTPGFLKTAQEVVSRLKAARAARAGAGNPPQANAAKPNESHVGDNQTPGPYHEAAFTTVAPAAAESAVPLSVARRDAWRTVLFILTVLAAPLAFWKGSSFARARSFARASLPGPRPNIQSLPPSSDA